MDRFLRSFCAVFWFCMASTGAQALEGNAAAGARKNAMCIGCHGIAGYHASFPDVYRVPKISGQNAAYIVSALTAYKTGARQHPTMRGVADGLSEQDMADLAAYYSTSVPTSPQAVEAVKSPEGSAAALALLAKGGCASCHGENFSKPIDPSYPKIAGQNGDYLYAALRAYQAEGKNLVGRKQPIMNGMVKQFTAAELKVMANYIGGLPGDLRTIQSSHAR